MGAFDGQGGSAATAGAAAGGAAASLAGSAEVSTGGAAAQGSGATCTPGAGTTEIAAGVLRDNKTCLAWEEAPGFVGGGTWLPSKKYCDDLVLGGFDDWRMPTNPELNSTPVKFVGRLTTAPRYVPSGASDPSVDYHYCAVTQWDPNVARACGWPGPGQNMDGTICVRGQAAVALTPPDACTCASGEAGFVPWAD